MTAISESNAGGVRRSALARVSARSFGDTEWVTLALAACARHLEPAIVAGQPHRIVNAVRALAHVPTAEQRADVITAVCDDLLARAYADRDVTLIAGVADARAVIELVLNDLDANVERTPVEPALLRAIVDGLVRMAALVDQHRADNLDATGRFAARIAVALHFTRQAALDVECAGRLHAIGTLAKPGVPRANDDAAGRNAMLGESFVAGIPALAHLAPIVRAQGERFDGAGIPDGLQGTAIPPAARIIAVAAAFIGLIAQRPNESVMAPHEACAELARGSGTRFDPDVVAATLQLLHVRRRTHRSA